MAHLIFQNKKEIKTSNVGQLDKIKLAQLNFAAEMYFGEEFENPEDMFFPNQEEGLVNCELWEVISAEDSEEVLYDVWILNADSGDVFFHDTDVSTGIGMNQFHFDAEDKEDEELAKELQKALNKAVKG
jgi:hypothetical protein